MLKLVRLEYIPFYNNHNEQSHIITTKNRTSTIDNPILTYFANLFFSTIAAAMLRNKLITARIKTAIIFDRAESNGMSSRAIATNSPNAVKPLIVIKRTQCCLIVASTAKAEEKQSVACLAASTNQ